jgi:hypothetical protein
MFYGFWLFIILTELKKMKIDDTKKTNSICSINGFDEQVLLL